MLLKNVCLEDTRPSYLHTTPSLISPHWLYSEMWSSMIGSLMASLFDLLKVPARWPRDCFWLILSRFFIMLWWLVEPYSDLYSSDWLMAVRRSGVYQLWPVRSLAVFATGLFPNSSIYFQGWGFSVDFWCDPDSFIFLGQSVSQSPCFPLHIPKYWMLLLLETSWVWEQLFC